MASRLVTVYSLAQKTVLAAYSTRNSQIPIFLMEEQSQVLKWTRRFRLIHLLVEQFALGEQMEATLVTHIVQSTRARRYSLLLHITSQRILPPSVRMCLLVTLTPMPLALL